MIVPLPLSRLRIAAVMVVVVAALGWLLFVFPNHRAGRVALPDAQGSTVEYLIDSHRRLDVSEVAGLPADAWKHWNGRRFIGARRDDHLWMRVTLRNPEERALRSVLEDYDCFTNTADAWLLEDGAWSRLRSGEAVPAREKVLPGREIAWPITVPAKGERVVWLCYQNARDIFSHPMWWPEERAFHIARTRGGLAEGIYLGGLLALLGYTTLLWMRLRTADFGYYVLYLGTSAMFILLARAQVVALGWPLDSLALVTVLIVTMAMNSFFLTQFARAFLESATHFPRLDRWLRGWRLCLLALALASTTTPWFPSDRWFALTIQALALTHVGLLALAIAAWRAGVWQARFFVLSFGCLFAGSLPMSGVWFWDQQFREAGMRGLMIGSALEMLLLSLALADRFVRTQRRLMEETEQRRMIEATYADELAEEVRERTRELRLTNTDKDRILAVIGHDLRSPLTGLLRSSEDTPGEFARDTTRTARALLLMIEDLALWARLRAGTRAKVPHPARALLAPAVALHHSLAEHDGVELVLDVPEHLRVETDLVLAQTLVRNLLANALKFARARVLLRAADDGAGRVVFTVGNDGPALPAAVAARLAAGEDEPLTATGGMGLRLCREICRALDMRLEADTGADGGTAFRFTLKRAADAADTTP